jgi:hypothetical protein
MLGDEYRMAAHGGLAAIVSWLGGGEPLGDEPSGMLEDGFQPLLVEICPLGGAETDAAAKTAAGEGVE